MGMRLVGYVRLSREVLNSTSVVRQREIITRACEARDVELVEICEDIDVSATKTRLDRPGLNAARDLVARGKADGIIVWRLDRLCRSVGDFVTLLDEGIEIVSATEPIDTTTPLGRAMAQVLQVFAELEARTTGLRVKSAREHLDKVGRWHGGPLPYGYVAAPNPRGDGQVLVVQPEQAATLRRAAELVLSGSPVFAVARALNDEGTPTNRGKRWSSTTLKRVLCSDTSAGRVVKHVRRKSGTITATHLLRDDHGVPLQHWPAILSPDEIERLRIVTSGPAARPIDAANPHWLAGFATCSGCGKRLATRRRREGHSVYACSTAAHGGECSVRAIIEVGRAEREVEERVLRAFGAFKVSQFAEQVGTSEDERRAVEEQISATTAALAADDADVVTLVERLAELKALRASLANGRPTAQLVETRGDATLAQQWATADATGRRELLRAFRIRVEIAPGLRGRWVPERVRVAAGDVLLRSTRN